MTNQLKTRIDMTTRPNEIDYKFLSQCIDLAEEALLAGDKPFGSILVDKNGEILSTARNRINTKHAFAHPEYELAEWSLLNMTEDERKSATMYTSGEHCPMCAGAHALAGIGAVVYVASGRQLMEWLSQLGVDAPVANLLPIEEVVRDIEVRGPAEGDLLERIKELHTRSFGKQQL